MYHSEQRNCSVYYKYKHIFSGAPAIGDIDFLINKCPVDDLPLINSLIKSDKNRGNIQKLSCIQMSTAIRDMNQMQFKDECEKYLKNIFPQKTSIDIIQNDILNKIKDSKSSDFSYIDIPYPAKKCPHCGHINIAPHNTEYIVCGVDPTGKMQLDSSACLNDWCFVCEKKLCKNWYKDALFNANNRTHNGNCCQNHALSRGEDYQKEYCHCNILDI